MKGTKKKLTNSEVFPSTDELIPEVWEAKLPKTLFEELTNRYEELGPKYLTEYKVDDRKINGMMYTDRIVNCREEIVDAVFCLLGQIFKEQVANVREPSENLYIMLSGLIEIYTTLKFIEHEEDYAIKVTPF